MTATATALQAFFGGFGVPAWPEGAVPETAREPYITYAPVEPEWRSPAILTARVWYRDTGYEAINAKAAQIARAVGEGVMLPAGSGYICIRPLSPLMQHLPMPGMPEIKVIYMTMQLNTYHMQGE